MIRGLALCAGIGGLELGLKRALPDYRCVGYVERDAYAASVLVARMEDSSLDPAPVADDLESFDGAAWRGCVDLVSAGFPCQPFSVAGKQQGLDDERWVWPHIARIIRDVGPRIVFLENVPGLLVHGLGAVLGDLAGLGFSAEWDLFSARAVGAPHIRRRCFILAWRVPDAGGLDLRIESGSGGGEGGTGAAELGDVGEARMADSPDGLLPLAERGQEGRGGSRPDGPDVAQPDGARRTQAGSGHGEHTRSESVERGSDMADAEGTGRSGESQPDLEYDRLQPPYSDSDMGNSDSAGLEGRTRSFRERAYELPPWPPGPSDRRGWERYLAAGGPPPAVRRGADGTAHRLDRLRCLGNAVVPAQAEYAFKALWRRAMT